MTGAPFVLLAVLLSLGMQPPGPKPTPTPSQPPPKKDTTAKIVPVEIIVGTFENLLAVCKEGKKPVTTIYVEKGPKTRVHHCVGTLHDHAGHGTNPALNKADVPLNAGDRVRWYTSAPLTFSVVSVEKSKEPPTEAAAPAVPFKWVPALPAAATSEVISEPVPFINGKTRQRYKVTFNITGIGNVDPDLICTM